MTDYHMYFSIIAEPLEIQLNKQGYTLGENSERYDVMLKHIFAFHMNGMGLAQRHLPSLLIVCRMPRNQMHQSL